MEPNDPATTIGAATARGFAPGSIVVVGIFVVAILAASFAWVWNYHRGREALHLFGAEAATLVRTAPHVAIIGRSQIANDSPGNIDISHASGLLNARTSLLSDASYRWNEPTEFSHARAISVRFAAADRSVIISFDFAAEAMHVSSTDRTVKLAKRTADGWKTYLGRYVGKQPMANAAPR
jgi:hypothetical protein